MALGAACVALASAPLLVAAPARAQDALTADEAERHTDRARTLFQDGVALVEQHEYAQAEQHFRDALALHDAPAIRFNLASVLYEQGAYDEAHALASALLADASTPEDLRASATGLEQQIAERAAYVRVEVAGAEGASLALDGRAIDASGAEHRVAAGEHAVAASRDGSEIARESFTVATGEHRAVAIDASPPVALPEGEASEPEPAAATTSEARLTDQWWFWTAIAGGVVVITAAIVIGVAAGTSGGVQAPVQGTFDPGVLRW